MIPQSFNPLDVRLTPKVEMYLDTRETVPKAGTYNP